MRRILRAFVICSSVCGGALAGEVFGTPVKLEGCGDMAMALSLEGDILYAGCGQRIVVYSVKNPLKLRKLGMVSGFGGVRQIARQNGMAYVATRESGFRIVDATNPAKPRIRSRFDCCELAMGVDVADGSKWKTLKFPGKRMNGIPRVSPEGLVALTYRIRRTIGLWDFVNPEQPKFSNQWTRLRQFGCRGLLQGEEYCPLWASGRSDVEMSTPGRC